MLGAALVIAIPLTPLRRTLSTPAPYLAGGLALVITLPHVLWQMSHGGPTLEFIAHAQREKIVAMAPLAFLGEVVLEQQPASLLVWAAGLAWLLVAPRARPQRLLGFAAAIAGALLMLQRAKPYYERACSRCCSRPAPAPGKGSRRTAGGPCSVRRCWSCSPAAGCSSCRSV